MSREAKSGPAPPARRSLNSLGSYRAALFQLDRLSAIPNFWICSAPTRRSSTRDLELLRLSSPSRPRANSGSTLSSPPAYRDPGGVRPLAARRWTSASSPPGVAGGALGGARRLCGAVRRKTTAPHPLGYRPPPSPIVRVDHRATISGIARTRSADSHAMVPMVDITRSARAAARSPTDAAGSRVGPAVGGADPGPACTVRGARSRLPPTRSSCSPAPPDRGLLGGAAPRIPRLSLGGDGDDRPSISRSRSRPPRSRTADPEVRMRRRSR